MMEAISSGCKRRWLECCHLSMPPPRPAACAGPACMLVTNIIARPYSFHQPDFSMSLQSAFRHDEQAKKRECVCEVEHSVSRFGRNDTTFYKRLVGLISSKQQKHYSNVISGLSLNCHPTICYLIRVSGAVVHLTTVQGVRIR